MSKSYVTGFGRIGEQRELKFALEAYWAGKSDFAYDLYLKFVEETKKYVRIVETGKFGHRMDIDCKLNGPFSVICESTGREHE